MAPKRTITSNALGKHIGHAVEGHCRGILKWLLSAKGYVVLRKLPFDFPVNPDIVILSPDSKIRCLGIVAYARDSKGTDKKFYRTRLEYQEIIRSWKEKQEFFTHDFTPMVLIYGTSRGWKHELIRDLQQTCAPTLFLPQALEELTVPTVVEDAFTIYQTRWEKGFNDAREYVEQWFSVNENVTLNHQAFSGLLENILEPTKNVVTQLPSANLVKRPLLARVPKPFSSRLRQGLSLASLFADNEILSWISRQQDSYRTISTDLDQFIRRGKFLDLVNVNINRSLIGKFFTISVRKPVKTVSGQLFYAPDRPDFDNWTKLDRELILANLSDHRALPAKYPTVFRAGAQDQIFGNWHSYCLSWSENLPALMKNVAEGDRDNIMQLILDDEYVFSEDWQPTHGQIGNLSLWGLLVSALAVALNDRSIHSKYIFRRNDKPSLRLIDQLINDIVNNDELTHGLLSECLYFSNLLQHGTLEEVAQLQQPRVLSLDNPCSWTSANYLAIVTNPSHNPLCLLTKRWLGRRYSTYSWQGWPAIRSIAITKVMKSHNGRVQWQNIGFLQQENSILFVETKSVTANNWGNKSKELYDRIAETRSACVDAGVHCKIIGILDGDLDAKAINEIHSGMAYDETYSVMEIIDDLYSNPS